MVALRTRMEPTALLRALHAIEASLGRVRASRWAPRTIDLDLVRYGERRVSGPHLTLPHPGLPQRDFWQRELSELHDMLGDGR
jgi:2-amino-4-hydroxy-6-hydroxymethyldihydropteridine diphosphokinase